MERSSGEQRSIEARGMAVRAREAGNAGAPGLGFQESGRQDANRIVHAPLGAARDGWTRAAELHGQAFQKK